MKLITKETLKKWEACTEGYLRFCELFPKGATLKEASKGLIEDGRTDWSNWLWSKCKQYNDYLEQTTVTTGHQGTATAGDGGTAITGHQGTATAGDGGTAIAGYKGTATAGDGGTATAGYQGTATAGNFGCISIIYWDSTLNVYRRKAGEIDGKTLKAGVKYKVVDGEFKEIQS